MKKLSLMMILIFTFSLFLCSAASADVITALAIEVNPDHLEKTVSYARILGYNEESNTLTVELIAPEVFDRKDVLSLQVGDSIYTGGQELVIQTIEKNDWDFVLNKGSRDGVIETIYLMKDGDCNYRRMNGDDYVWNTLAVMDFPVKDFLLFLDDIEEELFRPQDVPIVRTARELTARLEEEDASEAFDVGFTANNVYVVFDGEGNLAVVHRFYVPWQ
ncbi:MAG: hypothetical protein Q4G00_04435 [Clostridia bacterium]|nr:hypothetical protein [Clostridia bacterium]